MGAGDSFEPSTDALGCGASNRSRVAHRRAHVGPCRARRLAVVSLAVSYGGDAHGVQKSRRAGGIVCVLTSLATSCNIKTAASPKSLAAAGAGCGAGNF